MANQSTRLGSRDPIQPEFVPWTWLERRSASAFATGGTLLVASVVVPVGLRAVTEWGWVSGLVLVGLAVMAVAAALLGLYPQVRTRSPLLARGGALCAIVAGVAGLGLSAMVVSAVAANVTLGTPLPKPLDAFRVLALLMAGGYSLGFLLLGVARMRVSGAPSTPDRLLVAGGAVLLAPVVGELARIGFGVGPPPWILFPSLGLVAIATLAIGYGLHDKSHPPQSDSG